MMGWFFIFNWRKFRLLIIFLISFISRSNVSTIICRSINTWRHWKELLSFCHIAVSSRPGFSAPKQGPLCEWIAQHESDNLNEIKKCPSGYIYFCDLTMLAISSTTIRDKIKQGSSIRFMTPEPVVNYIQQHRLYE